MFRFANYHTPIVFERLGTLEELEIQYSQGTREAKAKNNFAQQVITSTYVESDSHLLYGAHNCHGKNESLMAKVNSLTAKANCSRQKQIHARQINSMPYFYPVEYTNLVWSVYILLAILQFAEEVWFRHAFVKARITIESRRIQ